MSRIFQLIAISGEKMSNLPAYRFKLVGKKVRQIGCDADGLGIQFEGGWRIAIWTRFFFKKIENGEISDEIAQIEGKKLVAFAGSERNEILQFDNGCELVIDLNSEYWKGAEAMALYGPDNLIVVWNEPA